MAIFKCKMCGGTIEFEQGASVGICDSCGTKQTLPRLDDDRRVNLYDRANHFRRNNEFDKAAGIYEKILNDDITDAEAYWSLVLCRYGIEYVEDPETHKRIPTVNRTQFTSIFDDSNYKSALQYADAFQRGIYKEEAEAINEIQKGILSISQKEEPFDIFICYKETDANGRRTQDSVLANDLYHQLTNEGFKVFFSRITLEDKLGTAYEPYIFAALNSAKVMVVLGTKPEYFNAVWVKNEWSRYLSLVKESGGKKVLIPAYRDMDPYDLPEEFSHLQAQDMSKLGFMPDLIRGIKKIAKSEEPMQARKETAVIGGSSNVEPLLKRAFIFLEDGNWSEADVYCEKVLDLDPENAQAYLGKLMAELHVRYEEELPDCKQPFDKSNNYQKAVRFGDDKLEEMLTGFIDHINERNENERIIGVYDTAVSKMNLANSESGFQAAAADFRSISGFKNADVLARQCLDSAEVCRKDSIYASARSQMNGNSVSGYEAAIKTFSTISGWKDADEQICTCQRKIEEIKIKEEADRLERERRDEEWRVAAEKAAKKRKRIIAITVSFVVICIAFYIVLTTVIIPKQKMDEAMGLLDSGDYEAAYAIFEEIGNKDAIASSKYDRAVTLIESGDYEQAFTLLNGLDYKDSGEKLENIRADYERILLSQAQVGDYVVFGSYEQDANTSNGKENIVWYVLAKAGKHLLVITRDAIERYQYNASLSGVTWEECSLRRFLNETFLNKAFSDGEQAMIQNSTVTADMNTLYDSYAGNTTKDKVFVLSILEVDRFSDAKKWNWRKCSATDYAIASGASVRNGGCCWWLRTSGETGHNAAGVFSDGTIYEAGFDVNDDSISVRPALWINLDS